MENPRKLLNFDEANEWLDEVADSLPAEIFDGLNGGVVLLPDILISPEAQKRDLFTLGLYHNEPYGLGRYIAIYYGSFVQVYGKSSLEEQKRGLKEVLQHELTHHIESLAGVRDLEVEDEQFMQHYKQENKGEKEKPKWRKGHKKTGD